MCASWGVVIDGIEWNFSILTSNNFLGLLHASSCHSGIDMMEETIFAASDVS